MFSKPKARQIIQVRIDQTPQKDFEVWSRSALLNLQASLERYSNNKELFTVLSYTALPEWREVDVAQLEHTFNTVKFDYVPMGRAAPFPPGAYDVILVPLFGFNQNNHRLGHGGGWYDKFLATQPDTYKIGIGIEKNSIEFLVDHFDVRMDEIITEKHP